ncbi:hypothetical protein CPB83DRAFT_900047 [Crepidotus variabilis]|uniref:Uncharacterized protein n=1 Tax=Crepidotus variabilis TaxID=179855 RepID=A0A9P6JIG1_9AGAR|nr:hypothetical protein CPB83DRAFT_900047 [Crepidotus variabilis]
MSYADIVQGKPSVVQPQPQQATQKQVDNQVDAQFAWSVLGQPHIDSDDLPAQPTLIDLATGRLIQSSSIQNQPDSPKDMPTQSRPIPIRPGNSLVQLNANCDKALPDIYLALKHPFQRRHRKVYFYIQDLSKAGLRRTLDLENRLKIPHGSHQDTINAGFLHMEENDIIFMMLQLLGETEGASLPIQRNMLLYAQEMHASGHV